MTGEFIIQNGHVQLWMFGRRDDTEFVFDAVSRFNLTVGMSLEHLNIDLTFNKDLHNALPASLSKAESLDLVGQINHRHMSFQSLPQ